MGATFFSLRRGATLSVWELLKIGRSDLLFRPGLRRTACSLLDRISLGWGAIGGLFYKPYIFLRLVRPAL
jgi:hypothetical protein